MRRLIIESWWVVLFCAGSFWVYAEAMHKKRGDEISLQQQMEMMLKQKQSLLEQYEDLKLQVNSQQDPAWVELTLMKELGVVPKGHVKVFFQPERG